MKYEVEQKFPVANLTDVEAKLASAEEKVSKITRSADGAVAGVVERVDRLVLGREAVGIDAALLGRHQRLRHQRGECVAVPAKDRVAAADFGEGLVAAGLRPAVGIEVGVEAGRVAGPPGLPSSNRNVL